MFNCELRKEEGFMINKSLADMRNGIKQFIKQSIYSGENENKFLPIFYEKEIFPYCRNINIMDNYFDYFYDDASI